jgi:hypothetical protein
MGDLTDPMGNHITIVEKLRFTAAPKNEVVLDAAAISQMDDDAESTIGLGQSNPSKSLPTEGGLMLFLIDRSSSSQEDWDFNQRRR